MTRPILQLGGTIVESRPKTRAGERRVSLGPVSLVLLKAQRTAQKRERLAWAGAYEDNDLVFCREDGSPLSPAWVTRHLYRLAAAAGLPRIKLHEGRHTAATLGLETGLDEKVVSEQLGHSSTRITRDLYTHVHRAMHDQAAETVETLSTSTRKTAGAETGS